MTSLSDSDNESVDSGEDSDTWNWRNAENNRLIIQLYKYDKEQDKRLDKLEQRVNGIMSLVGINEVPENVGLDGFDQLIPDNDTLNNPDNQQPEGGKRRRKRKTKNKRKKKRKKTRRKKKRKGRKTRRK